jgi:hypothetical protein
MKKKVLLISIIIALLLMVGTVYAYIIEDGGSSHTHVWQSYYSKINESVHGIKCKTCEQYKSGSRVYHSTTLEADKATCTTKAICGKCGQYYGQPLEHFYMYTIVDDKTHLLKCTLCGKNNGAEPHIFKYDLTKGHICTECDFKGDVQHRFGPFFNCLYNGCTERLQVISPGYADLTAMSGYEPHPKDNPSKRDSGITINLTWPPIDENGNEMKITVKVEEYEAQTEEWHLKEFLDDNPGSTRSEYNSRKGYNMWLAQLRKAGKVGGKTEVSVTGSGKQYSFNLPHTDRRFFSYVYINGQLISSGNKRIQKGVPSAPSLPSGKVWVIGRDKDTGESLYGPIKDSVGISMSGTKKTYTAQPIDNYTIVGYIVEDNLISSLIPPLTATQTGTKADIQLTLENDEKLITFVYEFVKCGINAQVSHIDENTDKLMDGTSVDEFDLNKLIHIYDIKDEDFIDEFLKITMGNQPDDVRTKGALSLMSSFWKTKTVPEFRSLNLNAARYSDYKNRYALIDGIKVTKDSSGNNIKLKDRYTPSLDDVLSSLTIKDKILPVKFYYAQTSVHITHYDATKNEIIKIEIINTPADVKSLDLSGRLEGYVNKGYKLEGIDYIPVNIDTPYSVPVPAEGVVRKTLIFNYVVAKPILCNAEIVAQVGQSVGTLPQWVIGEEAKINLTNLGLHSQLPTYGQRNFNKTYAREMQIRFPFDIYFSGQLYTANTWIKVLDNTQIQDNNEITFIIPSWVESREYLNINVRTLSKEAPAIVGNELGKIGENDLIADTINPIFYIASRTLEVEIVDRVYDFTVTYLEGDTNWQNSLFGKVDALGKPIIEEYKAAGLPIGQNQDKPEKYSYGIKLGSPFQYSVNTIGIENEGIILEPKILYIAKDGSKIEEVDLYYYLSDKRLVKISDCIEAPLKTILNKQTRLDNTLNIQKELVDGTRVYANIYDYSKEREIGKYAKLLIGKTLRLPYSNYLLEIPVPAGTDEDDILKSASHWYGEYKLPSSTLAVKKGTVISGPVNENSAIFNDYKNGYLLVCFKISTTNNAEVTPVTTYLSYGLNRWQAEGYNMATKRITLPTGTAVAMPAGFAEYCPVALYQAGLKLNNDYETLGTH